MALMLHKPVPENIVNDTYDGDLTVDGNLTVTGNLTVAGTLTFSGLPTEDPQVVGQLWNDAGTLKVSAGA